MSRKTPSRPELLALLRKGQLRFSPCAISSEASNGIVSAGIIDAVIRVEYGERRYRFAVQCDRLGTPKVLSRMIAQALRYARPPEYYPLVVVPYLSDERLAELETAGVSGIDLCGNGVVVVPNELLVYRTGMPNPFRSEATIKNVFRGNSSLVARAFLLVPEYASVQEARREIERRGGSVALGTVSKVCKSLESALVIENSRSEGTAARRLRLLQPDKLLDLLTANYVAPVVTGVVRGKTRLSPESLRRALSAGAAGSKLIQTGFGSVGAYAVMARETMQYFYCNDLSTAVPALGDAFEPTDRFANITLSETRDDRVYFDGRPGLVASPVQVYLELATGDKRSQETAEQLRRAILTPLSATGRQEN